MTRRYYGYSPRLLQRSQRVDRNEEGQKKNHRRAGARPSVSPPPSARAVQAGRAAPAARVCRCKSRPAATCYGIPQSRSRYRRAIYRAGVYGSRISAARIDLVTGKRVRKAGFPWRGAKSGSLHRSRLDGALDHFLKCRIEKQGASWPSRQALRVGLRPLRRARVVLLRYACGASSRAPVGGVGRSPIFSQARGGPRGAAPGSSMWCSRQARYPVSAGEPAGRYWGPSTKLLHPRRQRRAKSKSNQMGLASSVHAPQARSGRVLEIPARL